MNKPSFSPVAKANRSSLCSFARRRGVAEHEIEDLVQDVLLIGHRKWSTFTHESSPAAWLRGILRKVLSNRRRKSSSYARRLDAYAVVGRQRGAVAGDSGIEQHELEEFLASLDARTRDVFVKFELEGYKGHEVAEALAVNPNTAASWLRNARLALRQRFECNRNWAMFGALFDPERSSRGTFATGFVGAVAVIGLWMNWPIEDGATVVFHPPAAIIGSPPNEYPPHPQAQPDAEVPPAPFEPPAIPPVRVQAPRSSEQDDARLDPGEIERLYYARRINAAGASTCALASLEAGALPLRARGRESIDVSAEPTALPVLWMDHVPTAGALLESACRRTYPRR